MNYKLFAECPIGAQLSDLSFDLTTHSSQKNNQINETSFEY
jgi:hypothetical protein